MRLRSNFWIFVATILMLLIPTSIFLADGQQPTRTTNGQQTAATGGQSPPIIVYPPPNPVIQQPPPPLPQGVTNNTRQNVQGAQQITDPLVLAIAFVGAAAGVIYRTIYPYFERLHEVEVKGEDPIKFLTKYKFTFGISLLISLVTKMALLSGLLPQLDIRAGLGMIFISSFVQGIGWNELTKMVSYKITDWAADQLAAKKKQPSIKSTAKEIFGVKEEKDQAAEVPKIIGRYPVPNQSNFSVNSPVAVVLSKPIDSSTISKDTFTLRKDGSPDNIEAEEIKLDENDQSVIFKPKGDLEKNSKYIVTISKEVKDQAGNKIASDETWSFTTMT
jgi:hypothetical protein